LKGAAQMYLTVLAAAGDAETTTISSGPFGDGSGGAAAGVAMLIFMLFVGGALTIFGVVCWCQLAKRLGHPWAMGLIMMIPVVGIIYFMILAFSQSPNEIKIKQLKRQVRQLEDALDGGGDSAQPAQSRQAKQGRSRGRPTRQAAQDRHEDQNDPGDAASALDDLAG
jgi:hypothetical protein